MNLLESITFSAETEIQTMSAAADERIRAIEMNSSAQARTAYADAKQKETTRFQQRRDVVVSEVELQLRVTAGLSKENIFSRLCADILTAAETASLENYASYMANTVIQGSGNISEADIILTLPEKNKNIFSAHEKEIINILFNSGITIRSVVFGKVPQSGAVICSPDGKRPAPIGLPRQ